MTTTSEQSKEANNQVASPSPASINLIRTVDLRPKINAFGLAVRNQGSRGTCSVFASTFLIEYLASRDHSLQALDFSEEYLNAVTNLANHEQSDGNFFSAIARGYTEDGIVDEVWFRYLSTFDPKHTPQPDVVAIGKSLRLYVPSFIRPNNGTYGITDDHIASIQRMLDADTPVAAGLRISSKTTTVAYNGLTMWNDLSDLTDLAGHSMPIVGYQSGPGIPGGGYFILRNSWGANWGIGGYGFMTFNYAKKHTADLVVYREKTAQLFSLPEALPSSVVPLPVVTPHLMDILGQLIHPASSVEIRNS